MTRFPLSYLLLSLLWLGLVWPTLAVQSDESPPAVPGDADYAAGMAAFERQDWQGVRDNLSRVVARRPWDDNAHNLLGFAYRQLGNYSLALKHYQQALDLNPHHRGALEYLGETYLAMGCLAQAHETLARLEAACKRILDPSSGNDGLSDCEEWQDLRAAIDASRKSARPACPLK
jgi:tetratricopeptide (TPR) repeat protein